MKTNPEDYLSAAIAAANKYPKLRKQASQAGEVLGNYRRGRIGDCLCASVARTLLDAVTLELRKVAA